MDLNTSYSAGVAYVLKKKGGAPELLLVLQKGGEKNSQQGGGFFVEKRCWKMPMGHYDHGVDRDLADTAKREFEEETGYVIERALLETSCVNVTRIPSQRPGTEFHEDHFFLVVSDTLPTKLKKEINEHIIEHVDFFPLEKLPDGMNGQSKGAEFAMGHKKKLAALIIKCGGEKLLEK